MNHRDRKYFEIDGGKSERGELEIVSQLVEGPKNKNFGIFNSILVKLRKGT